MGRPTGRPPKPVERKRRTGNPGGRALPEVVVSLPKQLEPPEPARPLGRIGRDLWNLAWREASAWLAPTDRELLLMTCEQADERTQLRIALQGTPGDWRLRGQLRALDGQIQAALSLLGFTPADRGRLGFGEVGGQVDALEAFRQRRADRAAR